MNLFQLTQNISFNKMYVLNMATTNQSVILFILYFYIIHLILFI